MNMIREINNEQFKQEHTLQEAVVVVVANAVDVLSESGETICESAISFLTDLKSKVKAQRGGTNVSDSNLRDTFGILAALEMLRYPQARKTIDSNSIRAFMNIIIDVNGEDTMSPVESKLLSGLGAMHDETGESGLELQAKYLHMLSADPKTLVNVIDNLRTQYSQIMSKIHHSTSTYSTHPSVDAEKVIDNT